MRAPTPAVSTLLALLLAACAAKTPTSPPPLSCAPGERAFLDYELLLGRSIPGGGRVTKSAFAAFIAGTVVPAFPDGFTVVEAEGHYRHENAKEPIREPSSILKILAPDTPGAEDGIARIAAAYKSRFAQDSVGIVRRPACVSF